MTALSSLIFFHLSKRPEVLGQFQDPQKESILPYAVIQKAAFIGIKKLYITLNTTSSALYHITDT